MKKIKSALSVAISLMLMFSLFCVAPKMVKAEGLAPAILVDCVDANKGDKNVAVNVIVKNNPGVASIALDIHYDKSVLSLKDFTYNTTALNGASTVPFNATAEPSCLSIINGSANIEGDFTLATLYFDVSDSATGECGISLTYDENNIYDIEENNVKFSLFNGSIVVRDIEEPSTETTLTEEPLFIVDKVTANKGDSNVAVNIAVKNNPGIASASVDIHYDESVLKITNFEYNSYVLSSASTVPFNASAKPVCLSMVNGTENIIGDFLFATLYFDVADSAQGTYEISLTYDEDNIYDINENNVKFNSQEGAIVVEEPSKPTETTSEITPTETSPTTRPEFVVGNVNVNSGAKNIAVTVDVKNNPGFASAALDIHFDESALTLTNFEYNSTALIGASTVPFNVSAKPPCISVVNGTGNITGDFTLATLYFDIADSAKGNYPVSLTYDEDNIYDINEDNIGFITVNGTITVSEIEPSGPTTPKRMRGDVNGDGGIDVRDATMIERYIAKIISLTDEEKRVADVNKDGGIDVRDSTTIKRHVAKIILIEE